MHLPVILPKEDPQTSVGQVTSKSASCSHQQYPTHQQTQLTEEAQPRKTSAIEHSAGHNITITTCSIPVLNQTNCIIRPVSKDNFTSGYSNSLTPVRIATPASGYIGSMTPVHIAVSDSKVSTQHGPPAYSTSLTPVRIAVSTQHKHFPQTLVIPPPVACGGMTDASQVKTNVGNETNIPTYVMTGLRSNPFMILSNQAIHDMTRKKDTRSKHRLKEKKKRKANDFNMHDMYTGKKPKLDSTVRYTGKPKRILPKEPHSYEKDKKCDKTEHISNQSNNGSVESGVETCHKDISVKQQGEQKSKEPKSADKIESTENIERMDMSKVENIETASKSKSTKQIQEHYLLSKPISPEEAKNLIWGNKLDLRLKHTNTKKDEVKQESDPSKIFLQKSSLRMQHKPREVYFLRDGIVFPAAKLNTVPDQTNQQSKLFDSKDMKKLFKSNNHKTKHGQPTYYIISNEGSKTKSTLNEQAEHQTSNDYATAKQSTDTPVIIKGEMKSHKVEGSTLMSPLSNTSEPPTHSPNLQDGIKEMIKDPYKKSKVEDYSAIKTYKLVGLYKNNNKRYTKQCYNSKLTVAQLLKNKRGEEELETMLKSDLNKSSNALTSYEHIQTTHNDMAGMINVSEDKYLGNKNVSVSYRSGESESQKKIESQPKHGSLTLPNVSVHEAGNDKPDTEQNTQQLVRTKITSDSYCDTADSELKHNTQCGVEVKTKGNQTAKYVDNQPPSSSTSSFSVKVGSKMVVMKKNVNSQTPFKTKDRKKLPVPVSNHHSRNAKDAGESRDNKRSEKDILVEKLLLLPNRKSPKTNRQCRPTDGIQDTTTSVSTSTDPLQHRTQPDSNAHSQSAAILQIWKFKGNTFDHSMGTVEVEQLPSGNVIYRRWHEFSNYPCLIEFTNYEKITKIRTRNIKTGFYLVTKTTRGPTASEGINNTHSLPCILSLYPPSIVELPDDSMAVYISLSDCGDTQSTTEQLHNILQTLQQTSTSSLSMDDRYRSITDARMSPRYLSPGFYSRNLQDYFSDLHTSISNSANKENHSLPPDMSRNKTQSSTKLKSSNSKVEALKKKQKDLLKTCRKLTSARSSQVVIKKSATDLFDTRHAGSDIVDRSYDGIDNLHVAASVTETEQIDVECF